MNSFEKLIQTYEEDCGAEILGTVTDTCNRIEFAEDGLPCRHTLGSKALDHGFIVSSVNPENNIYYGDSIPVWFKRFSMKKETRTVEVEKEATVIRSNGEEHVLYE